MHILTLPYSYSELFDKLNKQAGAEQCQAQAQLG